MNIDAILLHYRFFDIALSILEIKGLDAKALRAFRVLRPLTKRGQSVADADIDLVPVRRRVEYGPRELLEERVDLEGHHLKEARCRWL